MRLFLRPPERLTITENLWRRLLGDVAARGEARRESGAFLLGVPGEREVVAYAVYDDLDPDCLVGSINFTGPGFSALWELCESQQLQPIADLHTHPSSGVRQSSTDRGNPMIALPGHVALIAPHFLTRRVARKEIGVHVYGGERGWASYYGRSARRRIRLLGR